MKQDLFQIAKNIRKDSIKILAQKKSGNTAGNLSSADIFTALYFTAIKHPRQGQHDRVFVSAHLEATWHATLAHAGHFSKKELLQPSRELPKATQPGHGLSIALGSALAAAMDLKTHHTYCIMSDAEHHHGQVWESLMHAGKHKLSNLTLIIDRNNTQADGYIEDIAPLEPLRAKYEAFNWQVIEVDGHNLQHITEALAEAKTMTTKPTAIIAHTTPGKGVSFIENNYEWHAKTPTKEEEQEALTELQ